MSLSTPSPNEYLLLTLSNTGFFRLSLHGGGGGGEWLWPVTLELFIRLKHNLAHS